MYTDLPLDSEIWRLKGIQAELYTKSMLWYLGEYIQTACLQ